MVATGLGSLLLAGVLEPSKISTHVTVLQSSRLESTSLFFRRQSLKQREPGGKRGWEARLNGA